MSEGLEGTGDCGSGGSRRLGVWRVQGSRGLKGTGDWGSGGCR